MEISITVEELEIKVSIETAQVMQKLEALRVKIFEVFAKTTAPLVNGMAQANGATQKMTTQSVAAYDKVNVKIREQEALLKSLATARFKVATQIKDKYSLVGASPLMQKQMEPVLNGYVLKDKGIIQMDKQIDKVLAKLTELRARAQARAAPAMARVAEESQKIAPQMDNAAKAVQRIAPAAKAATAKVKTLGSQMKSTANQGILSFNNLGKVIARTFKFFVVYKAMRAVFGFIKTGIKDAINAPEIENMFRVAFGSASKEAALFAEALKKAYGIDTYVSKQMLGTFQNMTTSMGIAQKQAIKMSKGMTLLANDMASLYNVDPQQASENLQSALSGQGKAVRKYGYIILDSTIKETAYRLGIAKTGVELTEQQKVLARYMTLMEQSKNAQGDLGRTIDNIANQLRILRQNITSAGRSIGEAFIPFIQAALPMLNTFFLLLQRAGTALATFTFGLIGVNYSEWKKQQESVTDGLGDITTADDEYAKSAEKATKAQKGLLSGFDKLNISQRKNEGVDAGQDVGTGGGGFEIPEIETPASGSNPFEKMLDSWMDKLKKFKDLLMSLGLKEVLDNFNKFFAKIAEQIKKYDFATAIKDALLNGFELAMSLINAAQRIVFPILIALDIPGIVFEAIKTISSLFENLNKIVRTLTPGLEQFVLIGLVPIAEWLGDKIRDGLRFLQEQFDKIGNWFKSNEKLFTELGKALGEVTSALWEVIKPLLDTAWDTFKSIVGGIVDIVLDIVKAILKGLTPALNKFSDWVKKNQKSITMFFDFILNLILQILAIKGITAFFKLFESGFKGLLKKMEVARTAVLKFTGSIMEMTKKGVATTLTSGFSELGKSTVTAFKQMGTALATFGKAVWAFVLSNPWLVAITAVLALCTAIGVTLYNDHKRTVKAMEEANYKKAFDGVPLTVDAVRDSMQGVVEKYSELSTKTTEYQSTMKGLQTDFTNTSTSIDNAFQRLQNGTSNVEPTLQTLTGNLLTLSSNLKTQVETDGAHYVDTWGGIFDRTSVLSSAREEELLAEMMSANDNKIAKITTLSNEITELETKLNAAKIANDTTQYAKIQAQLSEHYDELKEIAAIEQERQAEVELQRQARLAKEIHEGKKKVTKENYQELLGEIEASEKAISESIGVFSDETRANEIGRHKARMKELSDEKASREEIDKEIAKHNEMMSVADADYATSMTEMATKVVAQKTILGSALDDTAMKAANVQTEFTALSKELDHLKSYEQSTWGLGALVGEVDVSGLKDAKERIKELKAEIDNLANANPDMLKKGPFGSFSFIAKDAAAAGKAIESAISTSITATAEKVTTEGGAISENLVTGLKNGVANELTKIGEAAGGITKEFLGKLALDFDMHSPSKVMEKRGGWVDEGFANGITNNQQSVLSALDSMFLRMDTKISNFTNSSLTTIGNWAKDVAKKISDVNINMQAGKAPVVSSSSGSKSGAKNAYKDIPKLAKGGVLTSPRIIMGGEYAGASSNPEIVTPQSILYETTVKANQPVLQAIQTLIQTFKDSQGQTIELDGYVLGRTLSKVQSNNNYVMGLS